MLVLAIGPVSGFSLQDRVDVQVVLFNDLDESVSRRSDQLVGRLARTPVRPTFVIGTIEFE